MDRERVEIYTDGGCIPNPGKGGWAWAASGDTFDSGFKLLTTNNIMEMTAIIEAIKWAKKKGYKKIYIWTDSMYCVEGFGKWMATWQRTGWKKPEKNRDLWRELWSLKEGVTLRWVRGHAGNHMNEFVDALAGLEINWSKRREF